MIQTSTSVGSSKVHPLSVQPSATRSIGRVARSASSRWSATASMHALIDELHRAALAFFDLPLDDRLAVAMPEPGSPYGYSPLQAEALNRSIGGAAPPDLKETFNVGPIDPPPRPLDEMADPDERAVYAPNSWPPALPELRPAVEAYYRAMVVALGDADGGARCCAWTAGSCVPVVDLHGSAMRLAHYPDLGHPQTAGGLRAGAHTDYGTLTILWTDGEPGLQVEASTAPSACNDRRWIDREPRRPPAALDERSVAVDDAPRAAGRRWSVVDPLLPQRELGCHGRVHRRGRRTVEVSADHRRSPPDGEVPVDRRRLRDRPVGGPAGSVVDRVPAVLHRDARLPEERRRLRQAGRRVPRGRHGGDRRRCSCRPRGGEHVRVHRRGPSGVDRHDPRARRTASRRLAPGGHRLHGRALRRRTCGGASRGRPGRRVRSGLQRHAQPSATAPRCRTDPNAS